MGAYHLLAWEIIWPLLNLKHSLSPLFIRWPIINTIWHCGYLPYLQSNCFIDFWFWVECQGRKGLPTLRQSLGQSWGSVLNTQPGTKQSAFLCPAHPLDQHIDLVVPVNRPAQSSFCLIKSMCVPSSLKAWQ